MSITPVSKYGTAKFIVGTAGQGTHTTIAAAITAASSGDTIFIREGTYTENLTLKPGVNLVSWGADGRSFSTNIVGKATLSSSGQVTIASINLQTNSDFSLVVSGAGSQVYLSSCNLACTNHTGISYTATGSAYLTLDDCGGDLGTNAVTYFTATGSGGQIILTGCDLFNSNFSTVASTTSACPVYIENSTVQANFATTSTGVIQFYNSLVNCAGQNTACLVTAGTVISLGYNSTFLSGTASALSVGTGTTLSLTNCTISSSNANAITGAGTLQHVNNTFVSSSSTVNTTTLVELPVSGGGLIGEVWTSTGPNTSPTFQAVATSGAVTEIDGDTGTATPLAGIITVNAASQAGSTINFSGSSHTLSLNVTQAGTNNTILGLNAGNSSISGAANTSFGASCLTSITNGNSNTVIGRTALNAATEAVECIAMGSNALLLYVGTGGAGQHICIGSSLGKLTGGSYDIAIGNQTGGNLLTGQYNILLGHLAGDSYTSSESSNICIGYNTTGTVSESNVLRIGNATGAGAGALSAAYIQGIASVSVSNLNIVTINTSTGQLGSQAPAYVAPATIFVAYLSTAPTNVTGDGTAYKIICDTAIINTGSAYNTGTGIFTAPATGTYAFTGAISASNLGAAHTNSYFQLISNGSGGSPLFWNGNPFVVSQGGNLTINGSIMLYLTSGQTVYLNIAVYGSTKTVGLYGAASSQATYISGYFIG